MLTVHLERGEQKSKRMAELESKVDRCLRRCDSDLERFGNEIELEQPGIREKLDEDAMNLEPRDKNHSEATDEDDYQPTPVRRKNLSHNRNRRPSENVTMAASSSMSNSVPAPKQRRLSIPTNQVQNRQFHRSESSPVPLGRATREVPIATNTLKISTNTSRTLEEFEDTFGTSISNPSTPTGARPARVKKLTEKGKDWVHSLNKGDQVFRIPINPSSPSAQMVFEVQDGQWIQQNATGPGTADAGNPTAAICFICKQTLKPGIEMARCQAGCPKLYHTNCIKSQETFSCPFCTQTEINHYQNSAASGLTNNRPITTPGD